MKHSMHCTCARCCKRRADLNPMPVCPVCQHQVAYLVWTAVAPEHAGLCPECSSEAIDRAMDLGLEVTA